MKYPHWCQPKMFFPFLFSLPGWDVCLSALWLLCSQWDVPALCCHIWVCLHRLGVWWVIKIALFFWSKFPGWIKVKWEPWTLVEWDPSHSHAQKQPQICFSSQRYTFWIIPLCKATQNCRSHVLSCPWVHTWAIYINIFKYKIVLFGWGCLQPDSTMKRINQANRIY